MRPHLLLRADASSKIGTGHVMRCLALGQAWQDAGGEVTLAWSEMPSALVARLRDERFATERLIAPPASRTEAEETARLARARDAAWVVVDGYRFYAGYHQHLHDSGLGVMALDDMAHLERYPVDLLLNQNLASSAALYRGKTAERTELLLGPRYSLLRREFRAEFPARVVAAGRARRILVSCGGGDSENITGRVLRRMAATVTGACEVVVLVGAANRHADELRRFAPTLPFPCELRVDARNVAEAMAWADVAITAAGSTVWELVSMRLPALIGAIEENQLAGLAALRSVPFFHAGRFTDLLAWNLGVEIERLLQVVTGNGNAAGIDAQGASRVVEQMDRFRAGSEHLAHR